LTPACTGAVGDLRQLGLRRLIRPGVAGMAHAVDHHVVELDAVRTAQIVSGLCRFLQPFQADRLRREILVAAGFDDVVAAGDLMAVQHCLHDRNPPAPDYGGQAIRGPGVAPLRVPPLNAGAAMGGTRMPKLAGKVAWVTGAGSGIGEAAAFALAEEGATLVLTSRRREPLEDVARRLGNSGAEAHVQAANLTDAKQVQAVGAFIRDRLGRLDILVNNAGVNIVDRHWDKLTPEGIDTLMQGNVMAALYCVTVALPFMRAQQDGVMIHTSSMAGRF